MKIVEKLTEREKLIVRWLERKVSLILRLGDNKRIESAALMNAIAKSIRRFEHLEDRENKNEYEQKK